VKKKLSYFCSPARWNKGLLSHDLEVMNELPPAPVQQNRTAEFKPSDVKY